MVKELSLFFAYLLLSANCPVIRQGDVMKKTGAEEFYSKTDTFYNAGHRGTRGLMPENTIPAMQKGIEVGANTLEFDLQITKDRKVVLNHDNTLNPYYVTKPDGSYIPEMPGRERLNNSNIPESAQKEYLIYNMDYEDMRKYIIGEKFYPDFPEQQRVKTYIPLLTDVIDSVEAFTKRNNYDLVYYMPEIKSNPAYYGAYQPYPEEFVKIIMHALHPYMKKMGSRLIFQCADIKPLQILHRDYPNIQLAWLNSKRDLTIDDQIKQLGFVPDFYFPNFHLATKDLVRECHRKHIKIIPWTPDQDADLLKLINMGVDGIITNYPNRSTNILKNLEMN